MLAFELFLKNKENQEEIVTKVPIKKVFVKVDDVVTLELDSKTLEQYGDIVNQKDRNYYFQKALSMPTNNIESVGLQYRGTGSNSNKPYIELSGSYKKSKLQILIKGKKNKTTKKSENYQYTYDFVNKKETLILSVELLPLRLDKKSYYVDDKLLFDVYKEAGVINSDGAMFSKVFVEACRAFCLLWQKKIVNEELKEYSSFSFQIVILPFSLRTDGKVEYRCKEDADCSVEAFEDCFGNPASDYPSKATINAKFISFDDEAFTINCKTGKAFYKNLDIGNQSFTKINLPNDVFKIAGLDWYFFDISKPSFPFDQTKSGIYDQLLSNYKRLLDDAGDNITNLSVMKIICAKRTQAKLEVLLNENLTLDQMKKMFSRAHDELSRHPMALETLIIKRKKDIIWTDYLTAIRHFINGTFFDRTFLVQRFTIILRENLMDWLKGKWLDNRVKEEFFEKSQFCLKLLIKNESWLGLNKNEEYAYKIGCIAGKYVKFKRENSEANNSTNDILTYSKYDRERLRFVYQRIGIGISLSKAETDALSQSIKNDMPIEEIEDAQAFEDYSYFFYKGVFQNLT